MKYTARQIKTWDTCTKREDDAWVPARPHQLYSVKYRLAMAWNVLIGKYDALDWEQDKYK